ncbi:MAG: glycerate kinase [Nitrospirae bacterium]|nr:glycerate kinase [Nitrospirota bacterium]
MFPISLHETARNLYQVALQAVDPEKRTRSLLQREGTVLRIGGDTYDLRSVRRLLLIGAGKAGVKMAHGAEATLGDRLTQGMVIVPSPPPAHRGGSPRLAFYPGGHPLPAEEGVVAARRMLELTRSAGEADLLLCLFSGGGSALLTLPVEGITLEEKRQVTRLLLEAGARIEELNAVRKHLSQVKGGQLGRAAFPARAIALILSDVVGDRPDVIASGPCYPDPTTYGEALEVIQRYPLRDRIPPAVLQHLEAGLRGEIPETPKPGDPVLEQIPHQLIGNNALALEAAGREAAALGFTPCIVDRALQGEAREAGRAIAGVIRQVREGKGAVKPPAALLWGGETTVTVRGDGKGGRCQELALAAAEGLAGLDGCVLLAAGTDGVDGPTDAAGAFVNGASLTRALAQGLDPETYLAQNNAYVFFDRLGDLLLAGPTGTNVMDLVIALVAPRS